MSPGEPRLGGGRYELDGVLGRGGMAEVRLGHDLRLDRTVAVKRLRTDLASDSTFQARFRREAQSAASLNHPAIVAVYDTGEEPSDGHGPDIPYIVMEYVEGRTLRDILREGRKILPERALEITSAVLAALDYSHRAGIVHRDIKPANVMLTPGGDVKVMDFGIARAVADTAATVTQTAAVVGTAQYLSPEQARGEKVDARSDIYSTGCLLYELLTGRPPFVGDSPVAVAYQHVREDAPPPSALNPDVSPEIDAIVAKALAKPTEQRYQSAAEMRADIERALAGQAVTAPAVAAAVPVGAAGARTDVTAQTTALPAQEPPRRRGWLYALLALALLAAAVLVGIMAPSLLGGQAEATVPRVVGERLPVATERIEAAGLEVGDVRRRPHERVPAGVVLEQDPEGAEVVDEGSPVDLVVSSGLREVQIPFRVDQRLARVRAELQRLGLVVDVTRVPGGDRRNVVVDMDPPPGTVVPVGSTVTLSVTSGPTLVPYVVGVSEDEAVAEIEARDLVAEVLYDSSAQATAGIVVDQSPDAETPLQPGDLVFVTVSSRPEEIEPPPTETEPPPTETETEPPPTETETEPPPTETETEDESPTETETEDESPTETETETEDDEGGDGNGGGVGRGRGNGNGEGRDRGRGNG